MTTAILDGPAPDPAPTPVRDRELRRELLISLAVAATLAALGPPLGLLWRAVAPRVEFVMTDQGAATVQAEPEGFVAADGWFVLITFTIGLVAAIMVWALLRRRRGPLVMLGLVVGCVVGGVLTAWIGHQIGYAHYRYLITHATVGTHFLRPPSVRSAQVGLWHGFVPRVQGAVLVEAIAAATAYLVLAAFHAEPDLRRGGSGSVAVAGSGSEAVAGSAAADANPGPASASAVSWGPTESTAPPEWPAPPGSDPAGSPHD